MLGICETPRLRSQPHFTVNTGCGWLFVSHTTRLILLVGCDRRRFIVATPMWYSKVYPLGGLDDVLCVKSVSVILGHTLWGCMFRLYTHGFRLRPSNPSIISSSLIKLIKFMYMNIVCRNTRVEIYNALSFVSMLCVICHNTRAEITALCRIYVCVCLPQHSSGDTHRLVLFFL